MSKAAYTGGPQKWSGGENGQVQLGSRRVERHNTMNINRIQETSYRKGRKE